MAYIGHNPTNAGSFALIDDIASTFNGSNTTFTLQVGNVNITPNAQNTIIALDGVIQHTPESYTISGSTIAFTGAPASGTDFYGILMGNSSYVENNSIGADELSVSGDGTSLQVLVSDGDGTFSWLSQSALTPSANLVTGNTLKSTVTASSLTSVGTLTSLTTSGIVSTSKIFEASGQNVSHGASRIKISQENSALSEFRFYGADTSTPGSLRFIGSSSDGSVGNTRLTIASDGKVGIGEVNPSAILETTGAIDDNWAGRFENTHSGGYGLMAKIASSASGDYALQIRSGSTHLFKVMGNGDATFGGAVVVNGAGIDIANGGYISSQDSGSGSIKLFGGGTNKGGYIDLRGGGNSGDMRVYTGTSGDGTLALTINSSQNATFAGTVTTPGVQRTMVIDPKLYSKDNVYGTDDERITMQNDQQTIPLLPGYTITSVTIPIASNRTSFSWNWELCKHDEYATETVISTGNISSSSNTWQTMDVTDYTIENEQRVYFRISSVSTSGGTYGYMYNWRVAYTSPTTM